jgi:hypothetical protein
MFLLILSGVTAFPLQAEIGFLHARPQWFNPVLNSWIAELKNAVDATPPQVLYGTDWLAFAHIIIALFFVPLLIDPQRYRINLIIGMIACILVFPLAFICGPVREIPFFHQLIDCSFGVGGFALLYTIKLQINKLSVKENETQLN